MQYNSTNKMKDFVALLRGINVSGKNIIKMADLSLWLEQIGLLNIKTYLQSGNVLFSSKIETIDTLEEMMVQQIEQKTGLKIPILIMTVQDLKQIINENPFYKQNLDVKFLHITFLKLAPLNINSLALEHKKGENEQFEIKERSVYLYCPNGYGSTKLHNQTIENQLKTICTTRNMNTCLALTK